LLFCIYLVPVHGSNVFFTKRFFQDFVILASSWA